MLDTSLRFGPLIEARGANFVQTVAPTSVQQPGFQLVAPPQPIIDAIRRTPYKLIVLRIEQAMIPIAPTGEPLSAVAPAARFSDKAHISKYTDIPKSPRPVAKDHQS